MKVLIAETKDFSNDAVLILQSFTTVVLKDIGQEDVIKSLQEYDVFWFRLRFKLDATIISQSKKCKYIICPVTGLDHIDIDSCTEKGIEVISLRGETEFLKKVRATAELTLGLALSMLRNIHSAVNHTAEMQWKRELFKGKEIFEKKIGILGFGRLGTITASYFLAMGAEVYIFDSRPIQSLKYTVVTDINKLFQICDIVSMHVNLTESNKYMIQATQFEQMKMGSYFINTSRGQLVNSYDLIAAIKCGRLASAAVDVIENEFNYQDDLLLKFASVDNRLIATPHIGGNTYESFAKTELFMVKQLKLKLKIN